MKEFDYLTFGEPEGEQHSMVANIEKYSKEDVIDLFIENREFLDLGDDYEHVPNDVLRDYIDIDKIKEIYIYWKDNNWWISREEKNDKIKCYELNKNDLIDIDCLSTGLKDKNGKHIFIGDTVEGYCYDKLWKEEVRYYKGYLIPFECPDVSQFIQLKANECKVVNNGKV